jgi:hypothetical protein
MPQIPIPKRPCRVTRPPTNNQRQRPTTSNTRPLVPLRRSWRVLPVALVALIATACGPANTYRPGTTTRTPSPSPSTTVPNNPPSPLIPTGCAYRAGGELPDLRCTPGSVDPRVTPDNIHQTICNPGYTATVRPSVGYTNPLKRDLLAVYGRAGDNPRAYELDHLIPLALGGAPTEVANLWPEPDATPNPKDTVEHRLQREVCDGRLSLMDAQRGIVTDWRTAP